MISKYFPNIKQFNTFLNNYKRMSNTEAASSIRSSGSVVTGGGSETASNRFKYCKLTETLTTNIKSARLCRLFNFESLDSITVNALPVVKSISGTFTIGYELMLDQIVKCQVLRKSKHTKYPGKLQYDIDYIPSTVYKTTEELIEVRTRYWNNIDNEWTMHRERAIPVSTTSPIIVPKNTKLRVDKINKCSIIVTTVDKLMSGFNTENEPVLLHKTFKIATK